MWRDALARYLAARLPHAQAVSTGRVRYMPAGASNDTLAFDLEYSAAGREYVLPLVLRRERSDGILAPYDVSRQFRVLRALAGSEVPVPAVAFLERDPAVLGAPFFLMQYVHGETLPLFWYGGSTPRLLSVAEMLVRVHSVPWRHLDLAFLAGDENAVSPGPLATDLRPWEKIGRHAGVHDHPVLARLRNYLARTEPADAQPALLHGDPNPGNYLLRGDEVTAVVDWELAAIGDPRSDLGFYAALLATFGGMQGKAGRTLLSDAYEDIIGRRLDHLDYYEAVGLYKMAIVMTGWSRRGFAMGFDAIARRLDELLGPSWAA